MDTIVLSTGYSYSGPGQPAKQQYEKYAAKDGNKFRKMVFEITTSEKEIKISGEDFQMYSNKLDSIAVDWGIAWKSDSEYTYSPFIIETSFTCKPNNSSNYYSVFVVPKNFFNKHIKILV